MVSEPAVSDSSRGIRAGIHQQIEKERKTSFGDVDILPSILLIFTNKKQGLSISRTEIRLLRMRGGNYLHSPILNEDEST
jgi:hypothetical protein